MLKNNVLYGSLLGILGIVYVAIGLNKFSHLNVLHKILWSIVILTLIYFRNKSYILALVKTMKIIIKKELKYTLDLLTYIFVFIHFSIKLFNIYYPYELKNILKYIIGQPYTCQSYLSMGLIILLISSCYLWVIDSIDIVERIFGEIKNDPSIIEVEVYSWEVKVIHILCLLLYIIFFLYILYDIFQDGLIGSFGL